MATATLLIDPQTPSPRLRKSALKIVEGLFYHGDSLFTGVALTVEPDATVTALEWIDSGVVAGPCVNQRLAQLPPMPRIEMAQLTLEGDSDPLYLLQGQPFSGLIYGFSGDYCTDEVYCQAGRAEELFSWLASGQLSYYEREADDESVIPYENWVWRSDGVVQKWALSWRYRLRAEAAFDGAGQLQKLILEGDFFNQPAAGRLDPHFLATREDLQRLTVGTSLYLAGSGINDDVVAALGPLTQTTALTLTRTALSPEGILTLVGRCTSLTALTVIDGVPPTPLDDALTTLAVRYPRLVISHSGRH